MTDDISRLAEIMGWRPYLDHEPPASYFDGNTETVECDTLESAVINAVLSIGDGRG